MTGRGGLATIAAVNRWVPAVGAAALILATMVIATNLGATVRLAGPGPALPDRVNVDYGSRGSSRFAPLRRQYVENVLGLGPGSTSLVAGTSRASSAIGAGRAALLGPIVVTHPFTNGDFSHAYDIAGVPFAARTNTSAAKRQPGEPTSCSAVGGSAWYRFVPPTSMTLQADTVGSSYTTALGVFTGSSLSDLTPIGCAGSTSQPATVGFLAIQGRPYFFQIAGPVGGGDLHFQVSPHPETLLASSILSDYAPTSVNPSPVIAGGGHGTPDFRTGVVVLSPTPSDSCDVRGSGTCGQTWLFDERGAGEFDWSRQSVSSTGEQANGAGGQATVSADGRVTAFDSVATNLIDGDTNGISDIFVHDRATGRTTRESMSPSGGQLAERPGAQAFSYQHDGSFNPYISEDARYIGYQTNAAHLAPDDSCTVGVTAKYVDDCTQVMLRDRRAGTTYLVTRAPTGAIANGDSAMVGMAANGRYLLIVSDATNLTPGPTTTCAPGKNCFALLLWDRDTRRFEVLSASSGGTPANGQVSTRVGISRDGRFVSFASAATNLVPGATSGTVQTYVRDRATGTTTLVSVDNDGASHADPQAQINDPTGESQFATEQDGRYSSVSDDGRFVAFNSSAGLLPRVDPGTSQVYVRDRQANRTVLISVNTSNQPGNGTSVAPVISPSGDLIYFASNASDLVANDNNGEPDVFYRGWRS